MIANLQPTRFWVAAATASRNAKAWATSSGATALARGMRGGELVELFPGADAKDLLWRLNVEGWRSQLMTNSKYAAFAALDPFFDVVMQVLAGAVDGEHYFETLADDAVFEFRYEFPGFPTRFVGRGALKALSSGYGDSPVLHSGDALVVHRSQEPGVLVVAYEVHGKKTRTGKAYDFRLPTKGVSIKVQMPPHIGRSQQSYHGCLTPG